jgi:hypothetical protein
VTGTLTAAGIDRRAEGVGEREGIRDKGKENRTSPGTVRQRSDSGIRHAVVHTYILSLYNTVHTYVIHWRREA